MIMHNASLEGAELFGPPKILAHCAYTQAHLKQQSHIRSCMLFTT